MQPVLEEFAACQVLDEAAVGGEEIVIGEFFEADPGHLGENAILQVAAEFPDGKELQVHRSAVAIIVADVGDARPDAGVDAQFFVKFANQGLFGGFAGLDFSARELPLQGHGLIGTALANEHFTAAYDEGGGHKTERGPGGLGASQLLGSFHIPSVQGAQDLQNERVWFSGGDLRGREASLGTAPGGEPAKGRGGYSPSTAALIPSAPAGRK